MQKEAVIPSPQVLHHVEIRKTIDYHVYVASARGLRNADWFGGSSDAYCSFGPSGHTHAKTQVVNDSLEPVWNHEGVVAVAKGESIEFNVWDQDAGKPDDLLGKATLTAYDVEHGFNGDLLLSTDMPAYITVKVKGPGQEYPKTAPSDFIAKIEKADTNGFGLELDGINPKVARINHLKPDGLVDHYNKTAHADQQIRVGDFLHAVNDESMKFDDMIAEMGKMRMHELKIARPLMFTILVKKGPERSINATITYGTPAVRSLFIQSITEGPLTQWNTAHKDKEVKASDYIVSVNGFSGSAEQMLEKLKEAQNLNLVISRPNFTNARHIKMFGW